jgi:hypothetical protein
VFEPPLMPSTPSRYSASTFSLALPALPVLLWLFMNFVLVAALVVSKPAPVFL